MNGQVAMTRRGPSGSSPARTASRAARARADPTPLPSKDSSTSVWVKTIRPSASWYSAKPARSPSRWASKRLRSGAWLVSTSLMAPP